MRKELEKTLLLLVGGAFEFILVGESKMEGPWESMALDVPRGFGIFNNTVSDSL